MDNAFNFEVFDVSARDFVTAPPDTWQGIIVTAAADEAGHAFYVADCAQFAGWYWWACQPGCLPDGEAQGPFDSVEAARDDAVAAFRINA